jgi:NAD(P)-dependent dehydrogenase (short-subunit alcohol dehydrogenase family)
LVAVMVLAWSGARAIVTGGARGIGRAIVEALIARGARVVILDVASELDDVARSCKAEGIHCDVADAVAVAAAARRALETLGGLDLLVCSAGVSVAGPFLETPADDFDWLVRINFLGVACTCRALVPHLSRGGHVVTVASSFAWLGFPGKSAYAASKAAVRAFSESLRLELAPRGIGVTTLFPGPVDTGLVRHGRAVSSAQREAETAFLARRGVRAARVAERCLRGVERNAARVIVSFDYRFLDWLVRLSPRFALWCAGVAARRLPF